MKTPPCSRVRPATVDDLADLVELCAEHAAYEGAVYATEGKAALLRAALFSPPFRLHAWVAELNGRVVGYASAAAEFSTWQAGEFLHMDCLYVRADCRGVGVGARLLRAIVDHARCTGYAEIQWQTPDWNVDAQRFYRREGAEARAKQRFSLRVSPR
ncbi:MAG TPA: GNAT family N-acetyltransferase [Rhodanobacteraceae bacterium]|nr:GNAT family N-acetyltransferase [Rhodanobacteraceae bacterium]